MCPMRVYMRVREILQERVHCACYYVLSSIWMLLTIMCMPEWHTHKSNRVWIKYPLIYFGGCAQAPFVPHTFVYRSLLHSISLRHILLIHYATDYISVMLFHCDATFNPLHFISPRRFILCSNT